MSDVIIRRAEQGDLPALLDIYNHYVVNTPITFDLEPRTLAQRQEWLDQFAPTGKYQCFVAARGGRAIGWACSAKFKEKEAYATSIETSVYVAPGEGGKGTAEGQQVHELIVTAERCAFQVRVRIDTPMEVEYYRHGGILQYVLRQLLAS